MKRKTLRERAIHFANGRYSGVPEVEIYAWLAGYRAAKRERKKP
jgi:hypothetical protein